MTWSDAAHIASALSFALAFWLAVRNVSAERPRLGVYNAERISHPIRAHARSFAVYVGIDVVNLSRTSNAILGVTLTATPNEGAPLALEVAPAGLAHDNTWCYLWGNTWWGPPAGAGPTVLPVVLPAASAERLYALGHCRLDDLLGAAVTNELLMQERAEDVGGRILYSLSLEVRDLHGNRYRWPAPVSRWQRFWAWRWRPFK